MPNRHYPNKMTHLLLNRQQNAALQGGGMAGVSSPAFFSAVTTVQSPSPDTLLVRGF